MISNLAVISPNSKIGKNVTIGNFVTIYDHVEIGDNTIVEAYSELGVQNKFNNGEKLIIGQNSHIRSHSIFYAGSSFGNELVTGHRVTVRERTKAGLNLQIGTLCDIQGDCVIGDYVRFHSNVHIGQKSIVGNYVWIFPYVVLTNDPHPPSDLTIGATIGDFAAIATMSVILPGANIGAGVLVGAHSMVKGDAEKDYVYAGSPAKKICPTSSIKRADDESKSPYPWKYHFNRGYPEHLVNEWMSEVEKLND